VKTFKLKSCASTQLEANQLIQKKIKQPFVVIAQSQEKGQGRQGRIWKSPRGNIYFTLVLSLDDLAMAQRPSLSVVVGGLICEWMVKKFQIHCTLKWPNDIFFAGKKFCGILCDTSFEGNKLGPILVGVGLNGVPVKGVDATSLQEMTGEKFTQRRIDILAEELARFLEKNLCDLTSQNISDSITNLQKFLHPHRMPFVDSESGKVFSFAGIDSAGLMRIESNSNRREVFSAENGMQWPIFSGNLESVVIADVGNTRTKIDASEQIPFNRIFAASVNDEGLHKLREEFSAKEVQVFELPKRQLRSRLSGEIFSGIGIDRLCLIEDFLGSRGPKKEAGLIVSLGTAVTLDLIDNSGERHWGMIAPGLQTMLDSLNEKTNKLPKVLMRDLDFNQKKESTRQSMSRGCLLSTVGLIREAIQLAKSKYGIKSIALHLVGGDAEIVRPFFPGAKVNKISVRHGAFRMLHGG